MLSIIVKLEKITSSFCYSPLNRKRLKFLITLFCLIPLCVIDCKLYSDKESNVVNLLAAGGIKSDTKRSFSFITFFILFILKGTGEMPFPLLFYF